MTASMVLTASYAQWTKRAPAGARRRWPASGVRKLSLSYESLMSERGLPGPPPTTAASSALTAATPAAATSASTAAAAAAAASTPFGAGASLVDVDLSSLQLFSVQVVDRGLGFGLGGHLHKRESPWLATELVRDDVYGCDLPEGFKSFSQILFGDVTRQVSYVDIHSGVLLLWWSKNENRAQLLFGLISERAAQISWHRREARNDAGAPEDECGNVAFGLSSA